ncbi:MAG TPA: BTAD domain-containing putative transcriptional regulator [Nocardioides sp.]|uniref:AfsR/SARP family transcriptional regulator n=1 Tax=Nocardioides sp. TaxID=35761 RepID=UPI002F3E1F79
MTIALRLLGETSFDGEPVVGGRSAELLAALVQHRSGLSDARLLEAVWGDLAPSPKALQVLVSRVRAQCGPVVIERYDGGYRLGLAEDAVDVWLVETLVESARKALLDDPQQARAHAAAADDLLCGTCADDGDDPLAEVRRRVLALGPGLVRTHALALARCGHDAEAVGGLQRAHAADPDDVEVLQWLLRSEAASVGAPVALARYDAYRRDLADRLGLDPDPALQRVHRELLASDEPVRSGVRFDADELLGRAHDLAGLRMLVRTGRLTTILGPGGLGKTRIAHVLAREATQPRVHFVELVGISSPDDVVSEVGSALGVRNSVTGRRTLTPAQRADVRSRIAQELDSVPTLLVLDNCEHVLDAAASLVAFLLVTTRDLRVVTTSRAPLTIAAERVFPLSQLAAADGAELFRRRARAVRPDAELPGDVVAEIVERLDGLPLAVELAAARVRTMSVDDVRRALDDRFGLLRSRDRSAPARHQTLTAVISWSWDLLNPEEQRALAWLSVFQDGFSLDGAHDLLGRDGPDLVEALVDQSLLTVADHAGTVRYRMLETVREFGALRLADAGEIAAAHDALTAWAVRLATRLRPDLFGAHQVDAIDLLDTEETNLADVLRRLVLAGDAPNAVPLLASLGALWSVTGNFPRFLAMADLAERVLVAWQPPPELTEVTVEALTLLLAHLGFLRPDGVDDLIAVLRGLPEPSQPWSRVARAMFLEADGPADRRTAVLTMTQDPDRRARAMAWQWAAILAENEGSIEQAGEYLERALALVDEDTSTWEIATLNTQAAMQALHAGDHDRADVHARTAIPLLHRLHSMEDAFSMRASLALSAMRRGRLEEAERMLEEIGEVATTDVTASLITAQVRAELALVRGDVAGGLAAFDLSLAGVRGWGFGELSTNGLEPWTLIALATDLAAHARFAQTPGQRARADDLAAQAGDLLRRFPTVSDPAVDFPIAGMALAAYGVWLLTRDETAQSTDHTDHIDHIDSAIRLVALAHGFGYNRWFPVMAWEPLVALADAAAPGRLAAVLEEYDDRHGRQLRPEAERVLARLLDGRPTPDLTSSG